MLMTKGNFAEQYGLYRQHVGTAVARARLEAKGLADNVHGPAAKLYEERELAQAMIRYWREQRADAIKRANNYAAKIKDIAARYKGGQNEGLDNGLCG